MAKSFSHPRILPQRGGLRLSDQQRRAARIWYNWFAGGGAPAPETPNSVSGRAIAASSTTGSNDWRGRPQILKLSSGIWLRLFREATNHTLNGEGLVNINFSDDQGETWTANNKFIDGEDVTGFPYTANVADATATGDFQAFECANGDICIVTHERDAEVELASWKSFGLIRSTDGGASFTYEKDLGDTLVNEGHVADKTHIWACYDHFFFNGENYFTVSEHNGDLTDVRVHLYRTSDFNTITWISTPVTFNDGENPSPIPLWEYGVARLSDGSILLIGRNTLRTFRLVSTDSGQTWGPITEITFALGLYGCHQPRIKVYGTLIILSGRCVRDNAGGTNARWNRNAFWTSTDSGVTWTRVDLDTDLIGDTSTPGDAGYVTLEKRDDDSFYCLGYYGSFAAADIYEYIAASGTAPAEHKTNNAYNPADFNAGYLRLQMNRDSVRANNGTTYCIRDLSTGLFTVTTAAFALSGNKGAFSFNGSARVVSTTVLGNTLFRSSFSIGLWVKPTDGQPAAAQVFFHDVANTGSVGDSRVQLFYNTDGTVRALFSIGGTTVTAFTEAAIFPNGATEWTHIAFTFTSGELIRIYVNGEIQTLAVDADGDISGLTMANYNNVTNALTIGQRLVSQPSTFDLGYVGLMRELVVQPGVWDADDIANLMLN